jgi:alginate O-acetyltransferase complex protein AlgI
VISNIYLLVVVLLGWVIFRFTDMRLALTVVKSLFGLNGNALSSFTAETLLKNNVILLAVSIFASLPVMKILRRKIEDALAGTGLMNAAWNVVFYSIIPVILLLLSTASLVGDSYNPFIYFQF